MCSLRVGCCSYLAGRRHAAQLPMAVLCTPKAASASLHGGAHPTPPTPLPASQSAVSVLLARPLLSHLSRSSMPLSACSGMPFLSRPSAQGLCSPQ